MTYKGAIEIINKAWEGRKDAPDYPDYDDINIAIHTLEKLVTYYYMGCVNFNETRNEK